MFYEDFLARHAHTFIKYKGVPVYLYEAEKLITTPRNVMDMAFTFHTIDGKTIRKKLETEKDIDLSVPKSSLVNDEVEAFWCVRRAERQWKRTICKTNIRFTPITDLFLVLNSVYKTIGPEAQGVVAALQKVGGSCLFRWLEADKHFLSFKDAMADVESGKRSSAAFCRHYAIGMKYPEDQICLFRKNLIIGTIEDRVVKLQYPVIKQEVMDLSKRMSLDLEIV